MDELQEKLRSLERENSEFKAAKLMSMFANGTTASNQLLSSTKLGGSTAALER
jgi:hypothetical protein